MPAIGAIGDYPLSSYNSPFMAAGVGRSMVKDTLTGNYALQMSAARGETMAHGRASFVGTALSLALSARSAVRDRMSAFIAYTQLYYATSGSVAQGWGVKVFSQPLIGRSTSIDKGRITISPLAHMSGRMIAVAAMLPGPPFIATFLIRSISASTARGYRTIWQYLQGRSETKTFSIPGMVFERFLWSVRSSSRVTGRVSTIGTLPFMGRVMMQIKARRSVGVSPMTLPGGRIQMAFKAVPGIVRNALLTGRSKSRLVDALSTYTGKVYFNVIAKTRILVRLYASGRVELPHLRSLSKVSMISRYVHMSSNLSGHSDIRNTRESAFGVFLTLAIVSGSASMRSGGRETLRVIAYLTGSSEEVVRARTSRIFVSMTFGARASSKAMMRTVATLATMIRARSKSFVTSHVPVIFGNLLLLRTQTRMMVKVVSGTMVSKVALRGLGSIKDTARGLTRYGLTFAARARSRVVGRMPIPPFSFVNLPGGRSKSMSSGGSTFNLLRQLAASSWSALTGNLTPMSWPLLPNLEPGRHVCNTHKRIRYVYRIMLDQDPCECQ